MTLGEIGKLLDGDLEGDGNVTIARVAKIEDAAAGDITFLANLKYRKHLATTKASAILVARGAEFEELSHKESDRPPFLLRVADPYMAFLVLVDRFNPPPAPLPPGIHPTAIVAPTAKLGSGTAIGAHVVVGDRCTVGARTSLYHGTVLQEGVQIGDDAVLYPNVTVREECKIGNRAVIHSGTVIGSDGFGFAPLPDGTYKKIPQRGTVSIEDDVEIGANCAIDRATIGETSIRRGVKLDNLIHIAHNVIIGENTVIAAQTGISGSTKIGSNCIIAGQVGIVGHIEIADRVTLGAQSGISKSLTESGKMYFGYPAKEYHQALRIEGALRQLPELLAQIRKLEERCAELEKGAKHSSQSQSH
ncbi:MAG TPA: UDP-3-O-(3-hydroxymyristoyl)glucosamine N-acyltransferase [Bacteroidota bacterium]|jgi:UDP-3-O-[3-hydroxymyristoyl] glucosamine N-acyltransferase|nr:UDP-3-O-(3-hydroxymyristoyl)glucosamine N-acyltransferase [Bacteroidota bacterium]